MYPFEQYLIDNNLEALALSVAARVRYLTVYNAMKGNPIGVKEAEHIRQVAYRLCGVAYRGVFAVHGAIDEQPTVPIQRVILKHF